MKNRKQNSKIHILTTVFRRKKNLFVFTEPHLFELLTVQLFPAHIIFYISRPLVAA